MGLFDIFTKKEGMVSKELLTTPQAIVETEPLTTEAPEQMSQVEQTVLSTNAVVENPQPVLKEQTELKVDLNDVFEGGMTKEDAITQIVSEQVNSSMPEEIPPLATENPFQEVQEKTIVESTDASIPSLQELPSVQDMSQKVVSNEDSVLQQQNQITEVSSTGGENVIPSIPREETSVGEQTQGVEIIPTVEGTNPFRDLSQEIVLPETPNLKEENQVIEIVPTVEGENPFAEIEMPSASSKEVPIEVQNQEVEIAPLGQEANSFTEEIVLPGIQKSNLIEDQTSAIDLSSLNAISKEENDIPAVQENVQDLPLFTEENAFSLEEIEKNKEEEISFPVIIEEEPQLVIIDSTGEENLFASKEESVTSSKDENIEEQLQIAQDLIIKEDEKKPIRFCDNCGEIITSDIVVCPNCGEPIDA